MIQIDEQTRHLLLYNSIHREIILRFPDDDFEITGGNIVSESFELTQSICDKKEFAFGGGVAGKMQINVIGINRLLNNKAVNVFLKATYSDSRLLPSKSLKPASNLIIGEQSHTVEVQLFSGKIYSVKKQKNRAIKQLVAYDLMYELSKQVLSLDMLTSYVTRRVETDPSQSIRAEVFLNDMLNFSFDDYIISIDLRNSFSLDEYRTPNRNPRLNLDNTCIRGAAKKGINTLALLQAYAEQNAAFAMFKGNGDIFFKSLITKVSTGVYATEPVDEIIPFYRDLSFEEFTVQPIGYASFKYADTATKTIKSDKSKSCYISENILWRCVKELGDLGRIGWDGGYLIGDTYCYQPFKADVFARWWLEPGDRVQIETGFELENGEPEIIDSFVLSRKIKGINGMSVTIEAKGVERLGVKEGEERTNE